MTKQSQKHSSVKESNIIQHSTSKRRCAHLLSTIKFKKARETTTCLQSVTTITTWNYTNSLPMKILTQNRSSIKISIDQDIDKQLELWLFLIMMLQQSVVVEKVLSYGQPKIYKALEPLKQATSQQLNSCLEIDSLSLPIKKELFT